MEQVNHSLSTEFGVTDYELKHGLDFKTGKFADRDFVLVSYRKNEQGQPKMDSLSHIRGWIFDAQGRLLVKGFGFAKALYFMSEQTMNGIMTSHYFLPQGPMVRVMLMDDQLWFTTHSSLDAGRARYGDSDNFKSLLLSLSGLTESELRVRLFPEGVKTSNVVHVFTVCDLKVMPCFQRPTEGFVYYIGAYRQELPGWDHYEHDKTMNSSHIHILNSMDTMPELTGMVDRIMYTRPLAEKLYQDGVEMLVMMYDESGTQQAYRLLSSRMTAAEEIMGNEPNLLLRACTIVNESFPDEYFTEFELPIQYSCENYWMLMIKAIGPNRATEMSAIIEKLREARDKAIEKVMTLMSQSKFRYFPDFMNHWKAAYTFVDASGVTKENEQKKRALEALIQTLRIFYREASKTRNPLGEFQHRLSTMYGANLHRLITKLPQ